MVMGSFDHLLSIGVGS